MEIRRQIKRILALAGLEATLMEDVQDVPGEDLIEKFDRILLECKIRHILVYWPASAKMQTTYDELLLLRDRITQRKLPNIWLLHDSKVAVITRDRFQVKEPGGRSRYLEAVAKLGVRPIIWQSHEELFRLVRTLTSEIE